MADWAKTLRDRFTEVSKRAQRTAKAVLQDAQEGRRLMPTSPVRFPAPTMLLLEDEALPAVCPNCGGRVHVVSLPDGLADRLAVQGVALAGQCQETTCSHLFAHVREELA